MVRISSLPFPLKGATCTSDEDTVYLCFPDDNSKKCRYTHDLKNFYEIEDSNYSHDHGHVMVYGGFPTIVAKNGDMEILRNNKWEKIPNSKCCNCWGCWII